MCLHCFVVSLVQEVGYNMQALSVFIKKIRLFPLFMQYIFYDWLNYKHYEKDKLFYGWGIHLFTGKFGSGKTSLAVINVYKKCLKYPQLTLLTNLNVYNFPTHTRILKLNTIDDILEAPDDCIVLIDEIGTIFNSRDFMTGKKSVPKVLFQLISQCRKRRLEIYGTVQKYLFCDKQIRDSSTTVTECRSSFRHPFSRMMTSYTYATEEYEMMLQNPLYIPRPMCSDVTLQTDHYRSLYNTTEMVKGMLNMEYFDDETVLRNRGELSIFSDGSKEAQKAYKKAARRRR